METVGAALIVVGLTFGVGALVALHVLPTGLSVRDAVSRYGISDYALGYRVQTLGYALAGVGAAVGLAFRGGTNGVAVCCAVFAAARAAISWAPMDPPNTPQTGTGVVHWVLAIVAFGSIGAAARLLRHESYTSHVLALLMLASFVGSLLSRRMGVPLFGVFERALYLCFTAWFVLVITLL